MKNTNRVEFKRGQVWYETYNGSMGSEMAVGRPVVIVSSDEGNTLSGTLTGVYMTTTPKNIGVTVEVYSTNKRSWVLCQQIATLDKRRLTGYMCTLSEPEMLRVELGLRKALGLSSDDDIFSDKIDELGKHVSDLSGLLGEAKSKISELELEVAIHKKLYERALDKLVEQRLDRDVVERTPVKAATHLANDNFKHGLWKGSKPEEFIPYKTGSTANVNTDEWWEIVANTEMSNQLAQAITGYRNKNGKYETLDDLLKIPRFGVGCMKKYGRVLEV